MLRALKAMDRVLDKVLSGTGRLAVALVLLLAAFIVVYTLFRSGLRISLVGLFDFSKYVLIVLPFIVAAYLLRQGEHISIDFLTSRLTARARVSMALAADLVSLAFPAVLGWKATQWANESFGSASMTLGAFPIPKGILISAIAAGCLLLALQIIRGMVHHVHLLADSSAPGMAAPEWSRVAPLMYPLVFIAGVAICLAIFNYWSPVIGVLLLSLLLLFSGMPVFLALGLVGLFGLLLLSGPGVLMQVPITAYHAMDSFPLTCLPLFMLGGTIMEESGIAEDIFRFFELWIGRWVASTLLVTITVGMVFCAISGSSVATTAVVSGVAMPILIRRGFERGLSCGLVAGATVGTLIPPSVGYVIYGVLTGESIGKLFMATLIPAIILFAFYYLYVIGVSIFRKKSLFENGQVPQLSVRQVSWKERLLGLKTAVWGLLTPVIIIGGIYAGYYTPTEAAAILVLYAVIVSYLVKRISWRAMGRSLLKGAVTSSMILCIIFSAYIFALVLSQLRIARSLVAYAEATGMTSFGVIVLIFAVLIILGMFLEAASMKVITLPVFYPLAMAVGVNGLWLGVFYQFLSEIALLTPPVGLNAFVIQGVSKMPLGTVFRGCTPFVVMMVLTLVIMYFFPQLVTWLPSTMK